MATDPRPSYREAARVTPTRGLGMVLYVTGATLAFCGFPPLDEGIYLPLRGWAGVLGAVLLGVSPRAGILRSFGLMGLWVSGLFLGKNPLVFLLGSGVLLTGIALVNHRPPALDLPGEEPEEERNPPDGREGWPGDNDSPDE